MSRGSNIKSLFDSGFTSYISFESSVTSCGLHQGQLIVMLSWSSKKIMSVWTRLFAVKLSFLPSSCLFGCFLNKKVFVRRCKNVKLWKIFICRVTLPTTGLECILYHFFLMAFADPCAVGTFHNTVVWKQKFFKNFSAKLSAKLLSCKLQTEHNSRILTSTTFHANVSVVCYPSIHPLTKVIDKQTKTS